MEGALQVCCLMILFCVLRGPASVLSHDFFGVLRGPAGVLSHDLFGVLKGPAGVLSHVLSNGTKAVGDLVFPRSRCGSRGLGRTWLLEIFLC